MNINNAQGGTSLVTRIVNGSILIISFWFLETALEAYIFQIDSRSFTQQLISPNLHELWMRVLLVSGIILFLFYTNSVSQREHTEKQLHERMKLAELSSEIGIALTKGQTLNESLQLSSGALVKHLDALFARIWIFNEKENVLELKSSAGLYTHLNGPHSRIPFGKYKIGVIAKERRPHLTNSVIGDPQVSDQDWAKREKIVAFAGHPLVIDNKLIGVMALFSRNLFTEIILKALSHVADIVAIGIQQKILENKHKEMAITDELTGLLNRRGFFTLAEHQCRVATRNKKILALLYLDLDGLKTINDELGHEAGDQALVDTSNIFKATFRSSDIIARMGGDEFAVLLTDLPNPNDENTIVKHLLDNLIKHNELGIRNYELGISIGVAYHNPENSCSIGTLLNQADESMYVNKTLRRSKRDSTDANYKKINHFNCKSPIL